MQLVLIAAEFTFLLVTLHRTIFMTSNTWKVEMHVPALRYAITFFLQFTFSFATPTFCAILLGLGTAHFLTAKKDYQ